MISSQRKIVIIIITILTISKNSLLDLDSHWGLWITYDFELRLYHLSELMKWLENLSFRQQWWTNNTNSERRSKQHDYIALHTDIREDLSY